ncbi:DNA-3-methyladenine glycosylase 2 family protein [Ferrovibrio sp.]|uniref:DNA-3-methyladenine glycosylase family protein n=1 Tax=Ferrovibrio sp. TaxID=1917215 RepID=UPI001B5B01ED|nr:DNA-3-methyladenine glycosylase 2 family protein [Ferrovibrio sp.]MBP7064442.1 DNA-3-methyladenine glycosylase 2 family protein [Ferrovibrio sp.]
MTKPPVLVKPDKRARTLAALAELCAREPRFARALELCGFVADRRRPADFANLCRIIVEQQVSVASAAAIWRRVLEAVQPFEAATLLAQEEAVLLGCGLSRPKLRYLREIAVAVQSGALALHELPGLPDHQVQAQLTAVKGIGRWTAEIFLLFALDRSDIWPAHDVALQEAAKRLFNMRARPDVKRMDKLAQKWRPHRGVAARLLWRYYSVTNQKQVP